MVRENDPSNTSLGSEDGILPALDSFETEETDEERREKESV